MDFEDMRENGNREPHGWMRLLPILAAVLIILVILGVMAAQRGHGAGEDQPGQSAAESVTDPEEGSSGGDPARADDAEGNPAPEGNGAAGAEGNPGAAGNGTPGTEGADHAGEETDPQEPSRQEQGSQVDVKQLLVSDRVQEQARVTVGIDVSRYQGTVDWSQVAESGIDFAMIRAGYRSAQEDREIYADTNARYNMQEAQAAGIQVGVYFFSTAATEEEAREEARWVADCISQYQITYPVAFDCEGYEREDSPLYALDITQRTDIALAFLDEIYRQGYTPMFYGSSYAMSGSNHWDMERIEQSYKVWVSQYPALPYPQTERSSYQGSHAMWQYTNQGSVPGIGQPVDVNVAYFGYDETAGAVNGQAPDQAYADVEALMNFREVNETVTAKESTNLRNMPSQGRESSVLWTLQNGEAALRTGISDSGWSRLVYQEQVCYAVSNLLTTDLTYHVPDPTPEPADDGLKTKFTDCNELMTAKIETNLRALPSVTNPDAAVVATIRYGDVVVRTGINTDVGWSRVEYGGQVLYCVSSYLTAAPAQGVE